MPQTYKSLSLERVWGKDDCCKHGATLGHCLAAVSVKYLATSFAHDCISPAKPAGEKVVEDVFEENDSE